MKVRQCVRLGGSGVLLCWAALAADAQSASGICDRTPQVRDKILEIVGDTVCEDVSAEDLASIRILDISDSGISTLKAGDFDGLRNLRDLNFPGNQLTSLPAGLFVDLANLEQLWINNNLLASLPAGTFDGLAKLRSLLMGNNQFIELEQDLLMPCPPSSGFFSAATF